jgi:hypothetical protein
MMETVGSFVDWISNNKLVSSLVVAAILGVAGWFVKWIRDKRDSYSHSDEPGRRIVWPRQAIQEKRKGEGVLATRIVMGRGEAVSFDPKAK